jgi:predicted double-glycine peptidase
MPKGANLKIYGKSGSWYRVEYAGKMGWAWSRYVETSGAVASVSLKSVRNAKPVHSVKKLGRAGIVLADVPQISQNTKDPYGEGRGWRPQGYCGPAALQMVLAYYGTYKSRDYLALTHPVTGEEIRASEYKGQMYIKGLGSVYRPMVQMARSLGFARTHQVWTRSVDKLKALIVQGRPQIVSMKGKILYQDGKTWDSEGHIVVVCGVTEKGDVIINDPAGDGSRRVMSKNVFEKIWKGFSIDVRL